MRAKGSVDTLASLLHNRLEALPAFARTKPVAAQEGLEFCNRLFAIERDLADATPAQRRAARLERSQPVLDEIHAWLEQKQLVPYRKAPWGRQSNTASTSGRN